MHDDCHCNYESYDTLAMHKQDDTEYGKVYKRKYGGVVS